MQGQELDFIDFVCPFQLRIFCGSPTGGFCHSPLTVFSDFQELLCIVFVLEQELCYLFLAHFLQVPDLLLLAVAQLTALCWKVLLSCTQTKDLPNFPVSSCAASFTCEHTVNCCRD